jgi:hypothetical protein
MYTSHVDLGDRGYELGHLETVLSNFRRNFQPYWAKFVGDARQRFRDALQRWEDAKGCGKKRKRRTPSLTYVPGSERNRSRGMGHGRTEFLHDLAILLGILQSSCPESNPCPQDLGLRCLR